VVVKKVLFACNRPSDFADCKPRVFQCVYFAGNVEGVDVLSGELAICHHVAKDVF